VVRSINFGLDPWSRLATRDVAEIGAQVIVDAARMIGHFEQRSHDRNRQLGLFTRLALDAGFFSFVGFAPAARQHPTILKEAGQRREQDGVMSTLNRGLLGGTSLRYSIAPLYRCTGEHRCHKTLNR